MYLMITKLVILLKTMDANGKTFCDQEKSFDVIHTNRIYTEGNHIYSFIDIVFSDVVYRWNLKTNKILELHTSNNALVRLTFPPLPACQQSGGDCEELRKLSNKAILFYHSLSGFSYKITELSGTDIELDCELGNCDLPWNMSSQMIGTNSVNGQSLWPKGWIKGRKPVATYDYTSKQLIFVIHPTFSSFAKTKIKRNSITSNNWEQSWQTVEVNNFFMGLATLVSVKDGKPTRDRMDRAFGFILRESGLHKIQEFDNNTFAKSSYDYRTLFGCPQIAPESSLPMLLIVIGVVIVVVVLIICFLGVIAFFCLKDDKRTSAFVLQSSSSSSGGISDSRSSGSGTKRGRYSKSASV